VVGPVNQQGRKGNQDQEQDRVKQEGLGTAEKIIVIGLGPENGNDESIHFGLDSPKGVLQKPEQVVKQPAFHVAVKIIIIPPVFVSPNPEKPALLEKDINRQ